MKKLYSFIQAYSSGLPVRQRHGKYSPAGGAAAAFFFLLVFASLQTSAQQVIGSFPGMDGGFEGQTAGALNTTLSSTLWSRQGATSTITASSSARTGSNYAAVNYTGAASRNLQSPQASPSPAQNTSYTVQFFVKNAAAVTSPTVSVNMNGTASTNYVSAPGLTSANASWTKQTVSATSPNVAPGSGGILVFRTAGGVYDIDDVVIYAGAVDNLAPNSPGTVTVSNPTSSALDVSWVAASGGVDNGGYVVVRYAVSPNADNDPNQNGIYAVGNTHTNGTGSLTGTVRYIGTGTSFTDNSGLSSGTQYWYKVYTVDKAFNYSAESQGSGTTVSFSNPTNLSISASSGSEASATVITATATCTTPAVGAQTVNIAVTGTGITPGDYNLSNAQITIPNGATTGSVTFTIVDDVINEGTETATLTISSPSSGLTLGTAVSENVVITDNDDVIPLGATLGTFRPTITFDDLATSGTGLALSSQGTYSVRVTPLNAIINQNLYNAGNGSSGTGAIYSFGTGVATDRAFGSIASGTNTNLIGLQLKNTAASTMNALEIVYVGEQWRDGSVSTADALQFEYSTNATFFNNGTWNSIAALDFNAIKDAGAGALDGNNATNRITKSGTIGLGNIPSGGTFWIRWKDLDAISGDDGLSIDDIQLKPLFITPSVFYSKSSGDLNLLSTWGDNPDGSGNAPSSFTAAGQVFNIVNQGISATIGANWTVSGAASKVVVGDGVVASTFTVPSGLVYSGNIDISANGTLVLNGTTSPTFGIINPNSTVIYGATSGTQVVGATTYGNLSLVGAGTKDIGGIITVSGNLVLDGASLDKTSVGGVSINYAGNIDISSACTYNAGFISKVNFVTTGNGAQIVKGNGFGLSCSQFNCTTKTSGSLSLSAVGGSTNITTLDDIKLNMPAGTLFSDNGNRLSVGGDFETDGLTGSYNLTGTLRMTGITSAAGGIVHIRLNGLAGSGTAGVATLNNVVIDVNTPSTINQVNFQPIAGGTTFCTINGNLTIQGNVAYTGGVRFGTGASTAVRLRGDFIGNNTTSAVYALGGALQFDGSTAQTFSTAATAGESFFNVVINNPAGVTLSSGNMGINGNLNCFNGVLTTGLNTVELTSAGTITETLTSYVSGFVESTRGLTNAQNSFGGMGFEITNAGPTTNNTRVLRETGAGANTAAGCSGASVLRKFTVVAANNTLTNAITVYKYSGSVAELNGQNENFLNLFNDQGTLVSNLASLNTVQKSITITNRTSINGTYVAAVPSPTLSGISLSDVFICSDSTTNVNLSGLLQSGTFTASYTINGVPQFSQVVTASVGGTASFSTPNLTTSSNGFILEVTGLSQAGSGCPAATFSETATLDVRSRPTVIIDANDFVCELQTAPVSFILTGNAPWNINYTYTDVATTAVPVTGQATSPLNTSFSPPFPRLSPDRTYVVKRLVDANGCYAKAADLASLVMDVPVPCSITWNGSVNTDWNNKDNWTPNNSAPSNKTSVIIPGGVPQPNINTNSPAPVCAGLTLSTGAQPVIDNGFQLNVRGDLFGAGLGTPYFSGAGKLVLSGTGTQTITGQVRLGNTEFANTSATGVSVPVGSTLQFEPGAVVSFLANSKLNSSGNVILASSAAGTAKIGPIPATAVINGEITQERYLPYGTGSGAWYFLGSPFSGKNFTDFVDDFKMVGLTPGFGSQGGSIWPTTNPERNTVFKYDEPNHHIRLDTVQKQGWAAPGAAENVVPGKGYRMFVDYYSNSTHKFDNKGTITRNDVNFPLSHTVQAGCIPASFPCNEPGLRGWNLLANPYPCDLDWDATGGAWTKPAGLNNAFYTWNAAANGYRVYVGSGGSALGVTSSGVTNPNIIPSGQGFFVYLTTPGTPNLTVKEAAKITASAGTFSRMASNEQRIKIRLTRSGDNAYQYDAMLRMQAGATDQFDLNRDAQVLSGPGFHFGFSSNGSMNEPLVLQTIAPVSNTKVVPMVMDLKGSTGIYSFRFSEIQSLDAGTSVFLKDNYTGELTPITDNSEIEFVVNESGSGASGRFELVFQPEGLTSVSQLEKGQTVLVYPNPSASGKSATLTLKGFETNKVSLQISDALGRIMSASNRNLTGAGTHEIALPSGLAAGVYSIKIQAGAKTVTHKWVVK